MVGRFSRELIPQLDRWTRRLAAEPELEKQAERSRDEFDTPLEAGRQRTVRVRLFGWKNSASPLATRLLGEEYDEDREEGEEETSLGDDPSDCPQCGKELKTKKSEWLDSCQALKSWSESSRGSWSGYAATASHF